MGTEDGKREPTPPEIRRPTPRALREPQIPEREPASRAEAASDYMNRLVIIGAAFLTLIAAEPGARKDEPLPAPSVAAPKKDGAPERKDPAITEADRALIGSLNDVSQQLAKALTGAGTGKIARLRSRTTPLKEKCRIAGEIALVHMDDIVAIATFLQLSAPQIADIPLKGQIEKGMQNAGIKPEDFLPDPGKLDALTKQRIQSSKGYGAVQSCGFVVLTFFGGLLESGIDKNIGHAEPIVAAVIRGVERGDPLARRAGLALQNMGKALLK